MTITIRDVENPPDSNEVYRRCDYIELYCLASAAKAVTKGSAFGDFKKEVEIEIDVSVNYDGEHVPERPEVDDLNLNEADKWFRHLQYRANAFGDAYPFELSDNANILSVRNNGVLTDEQKLYVFLLLASCLSNVSKKTENRITGEFEIICFAALKELLPANAEVRIFGKNATKHKFGYTGKKLDRYLQLAKDIRTELQPRIDKQLKANDTGDGGLDLVGWLPLDDDAPRIPIVFAQCACGKNWKDKIHESSYDQQHGIFNLSVYPLNMMFIPYCYRNDGGKWDTDYDLAKAIIIDRLRIITLIRRQQHASEVPMPSLIDELWSAILHLQLPSSP